MKNLISVCSALIVSLSAAAFASSYQCSGGSLEGLSVSGQTGQIVGEVSWDCWPGGGICTQTSIVQPVRLANNDTIFRGPYFQLTIHTSEARTKDGFKAHIVARDMTDAGDQGRGLTIDQYVMCQLSR